MAHPEEPQRSLTLSEDGGQGAPPAERDATAQPPPDPLPVVASTAASAEASPAPSSAPDPTPTPRSSRGAILLFVVVVAGLLALYATLSVPGKWFPAATLKSFDLTELTLTRGKGGIVRDAVLGDALIITSADETGLSLVSANTSFASSDYPVVAWTGSHFPPHATARVLWRTNVAPDRVFSAPVGIAGGRLTPAVMSKHPDWVGRIVGLALAVNGPLPEAARVNGLAIKPGGVVGQVTDLLREWFAFERWSGTSINTITGGAEVQELPLPPLLVLAVILTAGLWLALVWRKRGKSALPLVLGTLFVVAWSVLDVQWTWNLTRQVAETRQQYGGKDWREAHVAADDGPLFEFVQRARTMLPKSPARVFVLADAAYFRSRGAYHLYPHNVLFDPFHNSLPAASWLRPGDYVLVYQRRGVQYDPQAKRLRLETGEPLAAEAVLIGQGAALFRIG